MNQDKLLDNRSILGYNLYAYCVNNPVNMRDDSGESATITAAPAALGTLAVTAIPVIIDVVGKVCEDIFTATAKAATAVKTWYFDIREEEAEAEKEITLNPPPKAVTYYHVTTAANAAAIMASGVLVGSPWEAGYVFAWRMKPNKYAIEHSGARFGAIISFKTYTAFTDDLNIDDKKVKLYGPVVSTVPGPISVWDVQFVG